MELVWGRGGTSILIWSRGCSHELGVPGEDITRVLEMSLECRREVFGLRSIWRLLV